MWLRKRMQAYETKRAREQLWQSKASYQQHEYWKSRTLALSQSTDNPSQMHHYREINASCSCDTCSLIKAQEMDQYYGAQGQPPIYLTSWPMQPQCYQQGFQPIQGSNIQTQYQEIHQPSHPRGMPFMFTPQPVHPPSTLPHQILHPACYPESRTHPPVSEIHSTPASLSTQPQGPALDTANIVPTTPQKIPHPAGYPEVGTCPPSKIQDTSPPSAFKESPTLMPNGSFNRAPLRPGGVAYDHYDLPRIVAVHSLPSSPVYVREQLQAATLPTMGSQVPSFYAQDPYDRNSDGSFPTHKVCLENRYPTAIEPDTVAEAENNCDPLGEKGEQIKDGEDNSKDQSNKIVLIKCEPLSPKSQLHESPNQCSGEHHNEVLADTILDQEKALQSKDVIDREMKIRTLLKRMNAWQIDFNQETDDIKKWKILNLILEGRAELEKLRLMRDLPNEPNPKEVPTSGMKGSSNEVVDSNASNEDTTAVETTGTVITMETNSDITAAAASDLDSRNEYATSHDMKLTESGMSPKSTMETHSDDVKEPGVTMETGSDMETAMETKKDGPTSDITMETEIDEVTSPHTTMEPKTDGEKTPSVTMETNSYLDALESDAVCANTVLSPFRVETTGSSVTKTNTDEVYSTNASTTQLMATNVTMATLNTNVTVEGDAMATDDSDSSDSNDSRNSSPMPDDFANTDFSGSPETNFLLTRKSPCQTNGPTNADKNTLLQPDVVLNVFDKIKLYDRRKTVDRQLIDTVHNEPEPDEESCVKSEEIRSNEIPSEDIVNRILDENLNQIHVEPISSMNSEGSKRLSPALPNIIKDPFATTEIKRKKRAGYSKGIESDSDDWTMELDENTQKAVFRRRWKRTGGHFDWKSPVHESQTTDGDEEKELLESEEWYVYSPPSKKRALLELRINENEDQNGDDGVDGDDGDDDDDGDDEQIINEDVEISPKFKNLESERSKRFISSGQEEPTSLSYPIDKSGFTEDLLASDVETADSPSNETSQHNQYGGVDELEAPSEDDFEESIFILERSLQLRESKIQRLNEKKEHLLDELRRIKASSPSSAPRDL